MWQIQYVQCSKCGSTDAEHFVNAQGNRQGVRCKNCGHEVSKEIRETMSTPTYYKSSRVGTF